jgi:hypothetical protein
MPLIRPTLLPGLARCWRGPAALQLGADPARAVVVDLPDARGARLLDLLDGSRSARAVLSRAPDLGLSPDEAQTLIDTLHAAGLVVPAQSLQPPAMRLAGEAAALACQPGIRSSASESPARSTASGVPSPARVLRQRAAARVLLTGRSRLGVPLALALAEAGLGHVHPDLIGPVLADDLPGSPLRRADVGQSRAAAATSALREVAPEVDTDPVRRGSATLAVQLDHDEPEALLAAGYLRRRQPHLAVSLRDGVAAVGPLVPAAGAPCLNCLDLHRRERDPGWTGFLPAAEPCAVVTVLATITFTAAQVLTFVDGGRPETLGATVEISAPGRFRRRTWTPHPACGCGRPRRRPPPDNRTTPRGGTSRAVPPIRSGKTPPIRSGMTNRIPQ